MATLINDLEEVVHEGQRLGLTPEIIRIKLKEKLQLYVLDFIYNSPTYHPLIFYGGTCLRICFGLDRMSEDVDFETTGPFDKHRLARDLEAYFKKKVQVGSLTTHVPGRGVNRVELRFPVLRQLGLSTHESENLIVKVEVNPTSHHYPVGLKTVAMDRFSCVIRHYDLPTLMAGKMLACLERVWEKKGVKVKGRDYYDLIWYMQKEIVPNAERLADAAKKYTIQDAFEEIHKKVEQIKPIDLLADLGVLFENRDFPRRWVGTFREQFMSRYEQYETGPFDEELEESSWNDFDSDSFGLRIRCRNNKGRSLSFRFTFSEEWIEDHKVKTEVLGPLCRSKVKEYLRKVDYKNIVPGEWAVKPIKTSSLTFEAFKASPLDRLLVNRVTLTK